MFVMYTYNINNIYINNNLDTKINKKYPFIMYNYFMNRKSIYI